MTGLVSPGTLQSFLRLRGSVLSVSSTGKIFRRIGKTTEDSEDTEKKEEIQPLRGAPPGFGIASCLVTEP
jgi:hypothetical protein